MYSVVIIETGMKEVSYIAGICYFVASEMAGSGHTSACCWSKLRNRLEYGKKQPIVWLQYVFSMAVVFLSTSFGAPLMFLCSPFGESEMTRSGALRATHVQVSTKRASWVCEPMFMADKPMFIFFQ